MKQRNDMNDQRFLSFFDEKSSLELGTCNVAFVGFVPSINVMELLLERMM
jgi:hypothetical protein